MTESNLELHKFLKVNWNLWICSSNSLLVSQNTLLKCTWSGPHIVVGYKIFEFPTLFTIPVSFFSDLSFLVLYLYVYLLISQLIFWSQFCLVSWDQLRLSIWEHLQNDRNGRINKKMSEQSVHLKAKTHSFLKITKEIWSFVVQCDLPIHVFWDQEFSVNLKSVNWIYEVSQPLIHDFPPNSWI